MGLTISAGASKDFEVCPAGTFIARCFQIIDLGTIKKQYKNDPPKDVHEIRLGFEVLDESAVQSDGSPFRVGNTYTASLDKKANLRKAIEAIRGKAFTDEELKGFTIAKLLGVYCQVTIIHNESGDKVYANISAFSPMHKSMVRPDPVNENLVFDLDSDDYMDDYGKLPKYYQERIAQSKEWNNAGAKTPAKPVSKQQDDTFKDDFPV